jgi:hypothetical protein
MGGENHNRLLLLIPGLSSTHIFLFPYFLTSTQKCEFHLNTFPLYLIEIQNSGTHVAIWHALDTYIFIKTGTFGAAHRVYFVN